MFLKNGYKPILIVSEPFQAPEETIYNHPDITIKRIPMVPVYNEVKVDETFDQDVEMLASHLEKILEGGDVVITHDVIYQNAALKHNLASRKVALKKPEIKWLHWIHSATSPFKLSNLRPYFGDKYLDVIGTEFPNSYYVFFNDYSKPMIAENFGVDINKVKTVHHPTDIYEFFGICKEVEEVADKKEMLKSDVMCVYPIRLDRGKQVEYVIKTMAQVKKFDLEVRVVIIDFHSTGGDKVTYRDELKALAIDWGLNAQEITFTSETRPEWNIEVPHHVVRDFMMLSNVFIIPSVSESYSLIAQEAGLLKHVMVFNKDWPPFRDIFSGNAIFRRYGSLMNIDDRSGPTDVLYGPSDVTKEERPAYEKRYHYETSGQIIAKLRDSGPMELQRHLMKNRNLQAIFKQELEPLLF